MSTCAVPASVDSTYQVHDVLGLLPKRTDDELERLAEDIHGRGQETPIRVWNDLIVDGRARLAACSLAGVTPLFQGWIGATEADAVLYIMSAFAYTRTELQLSQRATYATRVLEWWRTRPGYPAQATDQLAAAAACSHATLTLAARVCREYPEMFGPLVRGECTVRSAGGRIQRTPRPCRMPVDIKGRPAPLVKRKQERIERIRAMAAEGYSAPQIADEVGVLAEYVRELARKARIELRGDIAMPSRMNVAQMIEQTVIAAQGLTVGLEQISVDTLDPIQIEGWADSLRQSVNALRRLISKLQERTTPNGK